MLDYVRRNIHRFLPEKTIKILNDFPIPDNLRKGQKLDLYIKELLEEQGKKHTLTMVKDLLELQTKVLNFVIMGQF